MRRRLLGIIEKKKDSVIKLVAPKIVTALANIVRMGPRMIFRSTVELMRANLITRILSCVSLLVIDLIDLLRKRISVPQFIKNVTLSSLLIVSGTVGWNFGSRWIVLEFLGGFVDIAGGILGAGILSFASNLILDKVGGKLVESDAQKMWKILAPHIDSLPEEERAGVREQVTCACLKRMYASEDREAFAVELVKKLESCEKAGGRLRAECYSYNKKS
ncbi:MAG: hypothetical protein FWB97_02775 [Oscillospiraceae bacterium]|nr:hypothetical protein [Oscillospiraceae bacterium]